MSNPRATDSSDGGIFIFEIPPELMLKILFDAIFQSKNTILK